MKFSLIKHALLAGLLVILGPAAWAVTKTTVSSGTWSNSSIWSPAGIPANTDDVIIASGHTLTVDAARTIVNLTINTGGKLIWPNSGQKNLTINGDVIINGLLNMTGDITLAATKNVTIGNSGTVIWDPKTNAISGATFFTNGIENYSATSQLTIKNWYNYNIPLGSVVSSHFGNLTLNSKSGSNVYEWNQSNWFQTRLVLGTLTIEDGWITLDKSGAITNTTLKDVVLTSYNSYLYGHAGSHPGNFTLQVSSIINNGGEFIGLYDGNGQINLRVLGNITNSGYFNLIYNSGVANVGNGNATMNIGGTFSQSSGDTRLIYNVSTTSSGSFNATINNLLLTGGIFAGQTGVNPNGTISTLRITNNFTANFTNSSDIFRGLTATMMGSSMNNYSFQMIVGGNLTVSGNNSAEFTGSCGKGNENILITGNYSVSGAVSNYNYGTSVGAHSVDITLNGSYNQSGGIVNFSRNAGSATVQVNGNMHLNSGTLSLKNATGSCTINVNGGMSVTGGTLYFHNNPTEVTSHVSSIIVLGNFNHNSGTINFDNNPSTNSANQTLFLKGPTVELAANGIITHAGAGVCTSFGTIYYAANGIQTYNRSTTHFISQVKQIVSNGCQLKINSGNVQVASHQSASTTYFQINSGGNVDLGINQFISNGVYTASGIQLDSNATLTTANSNGFYNGSTNAAINSAGSMDYFLHEKSIIEYNGSINQVLTGTGTGIALSSQHQYGILKINLQGPYSTIISTTGPNVFIRHELLLEKGELYLNSFPITVLNGDPQGIQRSQGYVKSETNSATNNGKIIWCNISNGVHVFPFGTNATEYLPVSFKPLNQFGSEVAISTRRTNSSSNEPLPTNLSMRGIPGLMNVPANAPDAVNETIDRWWSINAPIQMAADITLRYSAYENTLPSNVNSGALDIANWNGTSWMIRSANGTGTNNGIGSVSGYGLVGLSQVAITANHVTLPIQLLDFSVNVVDKNNVKISWNTANENNSYYFTIERSADGYNFESMEEIAAAGNSSHQLQYSTFDYEPLPGRSYYRLKQTDFDGTSSYSEARYITFEKNIQIQPLTITEIGPNPFINSFQISLLLNRTGTVNFQLIDASGKCSYQEKRQLTEGVNQLEFGGLSDLPSGTYLFIADFDGIPVAKKLIKK